MSKINIDSNTADVIRALRTEASEAGDLSQVAMCDLALGGDRDAYCECVRVVIVDKNGSDNWSLCDDSGKEVTAADLGISAFEHEALLLESLTTLEPEGWVRIRRNYHLWWKWYDADQSRHSESTHAAERRCVAWVRRETEDGPSDRVCAR